VECAACGNKTLLTGENDSIQKLPMDPLIALYSAVPTQVSFSIQFQYEKMHVEVF
jgi:hypothetical protein